jgi:hypothetical protein
MELLSVHSKGEDASLSLEAEVLDEVTEVIRGRITYCNCEHGPSPLILLFPAGISKVLQGVTLNPRGQLSRGGAHD